MVPSNVTSDTQEKKKRGAARTRPSMPNGVPPLSAYNCTHEQFTHTCTRTHRHTNTLTHRLCAVRSNVLPYNPGYSINKLRECEIDYFFSLTVSHPSAQAYVDTHADTSTHSHCPAPPSPSLMFTKRV